VGSVLLDTTVLIDLLRGRSGAIGRLRRLREEGDLAFVCAVSAEEIGRGVRAGAEPGAEQLLAGLRPAILGPADGWIAGEWRRRFAARGRTLSQADGLIAAAALALGGRLATGNPKDFPMSELHVEHWPVGD
jgi:hypothetical protein